MSLPAQYTELRQQLEQTKQFTRQAASGGLFIKMGKDGRWTVGADEMEVEPESEWAINPQSFQTGFIAFDDGQSKVGEEMRNMSEPPVTQADLPRVNGRWSPQITMQMLNIKGEDEGKDAIFSAKSQGAINAILDILEQITERSMNATDCVPVVTLGNDSYRHKKYGKIYTPVFNVVRWVASDDEEIAALGESEPEEVEETEEIEEEEINPRRRRRRS